jgi:predicted dehydrogenase
VGRSGLAVTGLTRVGFVGLGIISETHLAVLADLAQTDLAFTVDPAKDHGPDFRGSSVDHYPAMTDALEEHEPDLLVIATPTSTHAQLATEALSSSEARILVEKPLVHDLQALDEVAGLGPALRADQRLMVAHHFAFAPEVRWTSDLVDRHPEWGPITAITAAFYDPYVLRGEEAFASYGSSWLDSGINQLSMLTRFVEPQDVMGRQEDDGGASAWCTVRYRHRDATGLARLRTSWMTGSSSKRTTLTLAEAGVEVWIDQTAMTAFAARGDQLLASYGNDGRTPRKIAHYRPLYESILAGDRDPAISLSTALRVTRLLHSPASLT